jgi:hypothetical protein
MYEDNVRRQAWPGSVLDDTKSAAGTREVDICTPLADLLRSHIGGRTTGLLFPSENGTVLRPSNLLRRSLHAILEEMGHQPCGFHPFRRFRVAHLRKQLVPEILLRVWIGHSTEGITDKYALEAIKRDTLFRTIMAQKAGLGFDLRPIAPTSCDAKLLEGWRALRDSNSRPSGS